MCAALPHGANLSPPAPARLLNFTALTNRLASPLKQTLHVDGPPLPTESLEDADELFAHTDAALVVELAALAGSRETARRRLRLLLALDAMMLWRPDGSRAQHDDWWAVDDGARASLPELDIPDLLVYQKGTEDERS